jgi:adenylate kinase family enzyme
MGVRNYLIDGGSGTGKTTVAEELQRRGYHVIHGDRELAYRGYPETGEPLNEVDIQKALNDPEYMQKHWIWDVNKVKSAIADHSKPVTFFCGGSRNFSKFIDVFDGVFVLEVDNIDTILQRLDQRILDNPTQWGGKPEEKEVIKHSHHTKEDIAPGQRIDASAPLERVVDDILSHVNLPTA